MKKWERFSDLELQEIVQTSKSYREVARKLGYSETSGGSDVYVKDMIATKHFDTSHFLGLAWNKDNFDYSRFQYGKVIRSKEMLPAIIKLRGHKCECCGATEWLGNSIPLEIHHIDGDRLNNVLDNLQLLCPNCHAMTENYKGKNNTGINKVSDEQLVAALQKKDNIRQALVSVGLAGRGGNYERAYALMDKYNIVKEKEDKKYYCIDCGQEIPTNAKYCTECRKIHQCKVLEPPTREELKILIRTQTFVSIGKSYGVGDNAVRKWCDKYSLPRTKTEINKMTDEEWEKI